MIRKRKVTKKQKQITPSKPVKYRSLSYNSGKNFILVEFEDTDGWTAQIFKNARLVQVVYEKEAGKQFEKELQQTGRVMEYIGGVGFCLKTIADVSACAKDKEKLHEKKYEIRKDCKDLLEQWVEAGKKMQQAEPGSKAYNAWKAKMDQVGMLYDAALEEARPEEKKLEEEFAEKWIKWDSDEINEYLKFGEIVEYWINRMHDNPKRTEEEKESIKKRFKERCSKNLNAKFLAGYFKWCEATEEEKGFVKMAIKEMVG